MNSFDSDSNSVAESTDPQRKRFRLGKLLGVRAIFGLAFFLAVLGYIYVIDIVDPRKKYDFIDDLRWLVGGQQYEFYSGSEGGFYIRLGKLLERRTAERHSLKVKNVLTSGGLENARKVSSSSRSFGLVQEDTLSRDDFLRDHIRYIAPLYLERMHILYDSYALSRPEVIESYQLARQAEMAQDRVAIKEEDKSLGPSPLGGVGPVGAPTRTFNSRGRDVLSTKPSPVGSLLSAGKISTGPVGSGSQLFARYLMSTCSITDYNDLELPFAEAISRLEGPDDMKIDAVFNIAGAPLPEVERVLKLEGGRRYKLMSIDASIVPVLNKNYGLRLQAASFKDKYPQGSSISTFGSWAFLIASQDASSKAVAFALNELEAGKHEIRQELGLEEKNFQLSEFNFKEAFSSSTTSLSSRIFRNGVIFCITVLLLGSGMTMFGMWLISGIRKSIFYRELSKLYEALPENRRIEEEEGQLPCPVVYPDQKEIIARIVDGKSASLAVSKRVRRAYSAGELRIAHYSLLTSTVQNLHSVFRASLAQRLHEYYSNFGAFDPQQLRHYFTAGYLSFEGYANLVEAYGKEHHAYEVHSREPSSPEEDSILIDSKTELFLSHRTGDNSFAVGRVRERLVTEFGLSGVFFDRESMPAGRDFREVLAKEVQRCDCLLAIIGPKWIEELHSPRSGQDYVLTEIETALKRGVPVIPVLLSPGRMPTSSELPDSIRELANRHAVVIRPDPEFHHTADILVAKIRQTVGVDQRRRSGDSSRVED